MGAKAPRCQGVWVHPEKCRRLGRLTLRRAMMSHEGGEANLV